MNFSVAKMLIPLYFEMHLYIINYSVLKIRQLYENKFKT